MVRLAFKIVWTLLWCYALYTSPKRLESYNIPTVTLCRLCMLFALIIALGVVIPVWL